MPDEDFYIEDVGPRLWMPYQSYVRSAECFNDVDLVTMLHQFPQVMWYRMQGDGVRNDPEHRPSVNQWAGYERELVMYWEICSVEFEVRFNKTPKKFDKEFSSTFPDFAELSSLLAYCETPKWRDFEDYYLSQKKILIYHDRDYYSLKWPHLYNGDLFKRKFYPIWPSRIDAFWPNGNLPGKFTPPNLAAGVSPEDVIDCVFAHTFREYSTTLPKPKGI